jgi:AraC-like DNA-binding protein
VTSTAREQINARQLLEQIRKAVPAAQGLVTTTVPRGGLQLIQPSSVPDTLVKSYTNGLHAEDRLTWQSILKRKPQRAVDCWNNKETESSPYHQEWLKPMGLAHAVAIPLVGPVLDGYPGAVHLCRTGEQGDFTPADVQKVAEITAQFDDRVGASRATRRTSAALPGVDRPVARLTILDQGFKPRGPAGSGGELDEHLRQQMVDHARRRIGQLNGDGVIADRIMLADAHGDRWAYRLVTFKSYPALGEGPFNFFCLQPDVGEWGVLKSTDFQADGELARLIPALRFMQQEFSRGPTLVDIARTVHLSPFHFHRRFTELLGLTPKQFLLDCQIHLAKTELLSGEKELVQIAKECGFAHQSHFTSRFKQATGFTPTRWRKMALGRQPVSEN